MLGVGSVSKFLFISDCDWQNFKDAVDELRSTFPGLHQNSETADDVCQLYSNVGETRLLGSESWQEVGSA